MKKSYDRYVKTCFLKTNCRIIKVALAFCTFTLTPFFSVYSSDFDKDYSVNEINQTKKITGKVVSSSNEALIGVTIRIKGTTKGTLTDANGRYQLNIDTKKATLVFSYVGMKTKEVLYKGQESINVTLKDDNDLLDEVVVIGYGTAKAKDLTGSVSRLSKKDIEMAPMTNNIAGALQGKSAGVNVMIQSASPTSAVSVVVRGLSSLSGDGQPLWIIDGVPQYSSSVSGDVTNTLYNLNLNDVQSIDILKDASATAIYGSRAANGVVLVTTKSGSEGMKPTIEISTRYGWQNIDSGGMRSMTAEQYKSFSKAANLLEAYRYGTLSYFNKKYMDVEKFSDLPSSQWDMNDIADMWLPNAYYNGADDYWEMMTQSAASQDYNIALRGGNKSNSYYASINYKDQDGIVKGSNSKNIGARFNFEANVTDKVKFGMNMNASSREANNKDDLITRIIKMRPDYPAYNEDGTINTIDLYTKNPLIELLDKNHSSSKNIMASTFLEYNIFPFLKFRSTINDTYSNVKSEKFSRKYYSDGQNSGTELSSQSNVIVWDNLLTYYQTLGRHDIQVMAGHSMEKQTYEFMSATGKDFPDDDILTNLNSAATRASMESNKYSSTLLSLFARAQYKYYNRYLLTATMRSDASSRFGKDERWGYFPSGALGWILSEENFAKKLAPYLSYLKLRLSYGLTGSQNLGYYDFTSYMTSGIYNGLPATYPSSIGNSMLKWESQRQTDFGIDYGLFNDRVRGTLGWYRKYVNNLITSKPIPNSSAFSQVSQNVGAISNTGIEFDITIDAIKKKDLTWQINFNASHNKGILEKLNGTQKFLGGGTYDYYKVEEGGELGRFYGYIDAGRLFQNSEEVWATKPIDAITGETVNYRVDWSNEDAGDVYVYDLNGDGKITTDDRTYLGSANPDLTGGFGSTFIFRGLRANVTFSYALGAKRIWSQEIDRIGIFNSYNAPNFVLNSWTMKGEEATVPVITHYGVGQNDIFTNRYLHDASYVRLSSLNLSYRLPDNWFRKFAIKGVEVSFQATNLFTITKYPGMDPQGNFSSEMSALSGMGTDYSYYPSARNYNLGLKFTIN